MNRVKGWLIARRLHFGALFLYFVLTIIMTWPVANQLGTHIPGRFGDAWAHAWTFHWIKQALLTGQNPFYTELLYFPEGIPLYFHNIAWLNIAVWLPLQALVGEWPAYALAFMAIFAFNGIATYFLAWEWTKSFPAAFVAGLIAGFWPYIMSRTDHPNLLLVGFVSLLLLFLTRIFRRQKKRDVLFAALSLALLGYGRWQLLLISGVLIGVFVFYFLITDKSVRTIQTMKRLAAVLGLAVFLMLPLLSPVLYAQFTRDHPEDVFVEEALEHTDLFGYVLPNVYHPLWGEKIAAQYPHIFPEEEYVPFIGFTVLLLALIGILTNRKKTRVWWIGAIALIVMALGVGLHFNGRSYPIPLPFAVIQDTFIAKIIRQPIRFNVVLSIPMAMLAAWGVVGLYRYVTRRSLAHIIVVIACLFILFEYAMPHPTLALEIPDWYQTVIAPDPEEFGILGIPMAPRQDPDKYYMFYQTEHNKPLVEGHVSRIPREANVFIDSLLFSTTSGIGTQMELLNDAGVGYVVLHKQLAWPGEIISWRRRLVREPDYEDDEVIAYEVARFLQADELVEQSLTAELGLMSQTAVPDTVIAGGSLPITLNWSNHLPINQDYDVCFDLLDVDGNSVQTHCAPVANCLPTSSWHTPEMVRSDYVFQVDDTVAEGTYQLALSMQQMDTASTLLGDVTVVPASESVIPELETAVWGDSQIVLPAYDVIDNGDTLDVSLFWQTQKPVNLSYKVFLHLIDSNTNELVAQMDFIPDNWVYPTNYWQCGEIVQDRVSLPIGDVLSGEYTLLLGLYEEESGSRFPVTSIDEQSVSEQIIHLATLRR